jgi:dipeptidyl aminopeptidase/acylaminoacyl peptidase
LSRIDYRLAPEAKLRAIIEDVQEAWNWICAQGGRFGIDADRIAAAGGSAGGYLTQMTGFCLNPQPRALEAATMLPGDDFRMHGRSRRNAKCRHQAALWAQMDVTSDHVRAEIPSVHLGSPAYRN